MKRTWTISSVFAASAASVLIGVLLRDEEAAVAIDVSSRPAAASPKIIERPIPERAPRDVLPPTRTPETAVAAQLPAVDEKDPELEASALVRALCESGRLEEYCAALAEGEEKQRLLRITALAAVPEDPRAAIALAQRMDDGPVRTDVLQTAVYDWMTREPLAATKWIGSVDAPVLGEALRSAAAKAIAASDPELAAAWLATALKNEGAQHDTALCVVETWSARDPAGAAAWVGRFPAQPARDAAIDLVAREWRHADPSAFELWFSGLPDRAQILARWQATEAAARAEEPVD